MEKNVQQKIAFGTTYAELVILIWKEQEFFFFEILE